MTNNNPNHPPASEHAAVGDIGEYMEGGTGKDCAGAGHDMGIDASADAARVDCRGQGLLGEVAEELAAGPHLPGAAAPCEVCDPGAEVRRTQKYGTSDGRVILSVGPFGNEVVSEGESAHGVRDHIDSPGVGSAAKIGNGRVQFLRVIEIAAEGIRELDGSDVVFGPAVGDQAVREATQGSGTVLPTRYYENGDDGARWLVQRGTGMRKMMTGPMLAMLLVFGCGTDAAGPESGFLRTEEGLEYRASTDILESFPVQLKVNVRITNASNSAMDLLFPDGCVVLVRAYRSGTSTPAWDQRLSTGCTAALVPLHLDARQSAMYSSMTDALAILGDSLPDGQYRLEAYLRPDTGPVAVAAGTVNLSLPRS